MLEDGSGLIKVKKSMKLKPIEVADRVHTTNGVQKRVVRQFDDMACLTTTNQAMPIS